MGIMSTVIDEMQFKRENNIKQIWYVHITKHVFQYVWHACTLSTEYYLKTVLPR